MNCRIDVEKLDKKMRKNGWKFLGAILHYGEAWKNQASIYEKDGNYVISGINSSGEKELYKLISKEEAEKRLEDSMKEIRKYMFDGSK